MGKNGISKERDAMLLIGHDDLDHSFTLDEYADMILDKDPDAWPELKIKSSYARREKLRTLLIERFHWDEFRQVFYKEGNDWSDTFVRMDAAEDSGHFKKMSAAGQREALHELLLMNNSLLTDIASALFD